CADTCITSANLGGCSATNDSCLCHSQSFVSAVTSCIETSCSGSDLQQAEEFVRSLCLAVVCYRFISLVSYCSLFYRG
ncbi:hypothetical protein F5141DRAFT_999573, partial [Pisolithus sp. B1]